jgi:uncharacterized protein (TIRG00374 family)
MKRLVSIGISLLILALIYWQIDFAGLLEVLQNSNLWWLVVSVSMIVPLTMVTSWRLQQLMPTKGSLGFGEANRLILASSVLNMVLPSKMGDIAKAYFMRQRGHLEGSLALSLVVFEKACDLLSLLLWCVFGLMFYPQPQKPWWLWLLGGIVCAGLVVGTMILASKKIAQVFFILGKRIIPQKGRPKLVKLQLSWGEMHSYFWQDKTQLTKIVTTSIFLWFLHLLQIWFFILALNADTPFLANLALSPLAILAGLIPLTFGGIGTRDAAFIALYQPYFSASVGAALGLLCTSRYLLPAIGGLPFLNKYFPVINSSELSQ